MLQLVNSIANHRHVKVPSNHTFAPNSPNSSQTIRPFFVNRAKGNRRLSIKLKGAIESTMERVNSGFRDSKTQLLSPKEKPSLSYNIKSLMKKFNLSSIVEKKNKKKK